MKQTLFDEVLAMPGFTNLDLTIGEYSKLKKQFSNESSVEPIINELNLMIQRDAYLVSMGVENN